MYSIVNIQFKRIDNVVKIKQTVDLKQNKNLLYIRSTSFITSKTMILAFPDIYFNKYLIKTFIAFVSVKYFFRYKAYIFKILCRYFRSFTCFNQL